MTRRNPITAGSFSLELRLLLLFASLALTAGGLGGCARSTNAGADSPPGPAALARPTTQPGHAEQWGVFEMTLRGAATGNPFDVRLSAKFTSDKTTVDVPGFYDGDGVYRVRFMPPAHGKWQYETKSDLRELSGRTGSFDCVNPSGDNHGPVRARNEFHFAYADGTPFVPISTTIYGWVNQRSDALQEQTLETLKASPFNRVRMAVLPIKYGEDNVPPHFPFEKKKDGSWDFERFDPQFFHHIEQRLGQLRDLNIEAELILFHNRDAGWTKYDRMPAVADDRYLRYVIARFSAYRNVWWNLANEFDSLRFKQTADWDRYFRILAAEDPAQHLRSIHQQHWYYDMAQPWVTYLSIQYEVPVMGFGRAVIYRQVFRKPVVFDEVKYEGDIPQNWGHLKGEEMVERFWYGFISGTYVAHGETFSSEPGVAWISRGGKLVGESPARIAFLKEILATAPPEGLTPVNPENDRVGIAGKAGQYYLVYFGHTAPTEWKFSIPGAGGPGGARYKIEVIDTWNMTITPFDQIAEVRGNPRSTQPSRGGTGAVRTSAATRPSRILATTRAAIPPLTIPLPGRTGMALRVQRVR